MLHFTSGSFTVPSYRCLDGSIHFHCPICKETIKRRHDFVRHLNRRHQFSSGTVHITHSSSNQSSDTQVLDRDPQVASVNNTNQPLATCYVCKRNLRLKLLCGVILFRTTWRKSQKQWNLC